MAKSNCVFCGKELSFFGSDTLSCAGIPQSTCKSCRKEYEALGDAERCRAALKLGLAERPDDLLRYAELVETAEEHRYRCLRCGGGMRFGEELTLDKTPMRDSIFSATFDVLPAYCDSCGKIEFFERSIVARDKHLAYLMKKDGMT